jgi:hypothetical protein
MKNIRQPQRDFSIWRYMKLEHFKELINESLFYFSNPNSFEDKREFGVPKQWLEREFWKPIIKEKNKTITGDVNIDDLTENFIFSLTDFYYSKDKYGVSCWYSGKSESELMWRANKDAAKYDDIVVIKSSAKRLFAAFDEKVRNNNMLVGMVKYANYDEFKESNLKSKIFYCCYNGFFLRSQSNDFINPIFYKRNLFKDEKEFRAVIKIKNGNRKLPINLDVLIDEVVIEPDFYKREESEKLFVLLEEKKIRFRKSLIKDDEPIKVKRNLFKKRENFYLKVIKEHRENSSFLLEFENIKQFNKWHRIINKKMGLPKFGGNDFGVNFLSGGSWRWCEPEYNKFNKKVLAYGGKSLVFIRNQKVFLSMEEAKKAGYFYHEDVDQI